MVERLVPAKIADLSAQDCQGGNLHWNGRACRLPISSRDHPPERTVSGSVIKTPPICACMSCDAISLPAFCNTKFHQVFRDNSAHRQATPERIISNRRKQIHARRCETHTGAAPTPHLGREGGPNAHPPIPIVPPNPKHLESRQNRNRARR